jgi:hypothetical protein
MMQLVKRAEELGIKDRKEARALVKQFKVKTLKRLETVVARQYAREAPAAGRSVDRAKANAILRAAKKVDGKLRGSAVKTPGPRGYRIGPVWLKSIVEGKGIALHPSNLPKLLCTAAAKGVDLPNTTLTQPEIVAVIAKAVAPEVQRG